ncbi:hypothetical protein H634G_10907 [Metarhizium anisopliae BRIP 53293]|uniref:Uncharacterized protein n=1 Tax=Metarhizium anisopliae BRIP 53293 TaxID=1291518 RepID=A0A0D9NIS3_METAN|nr:hypothetical protein H634G_10907 [Metarhizium anisopliae BRIP 53293]KJK85451.1 hypothetical protein H633G_10707 [Metarhizium anisopliae BRIP 53284]
MSQLPSSAFAASFPSDCLPPEADYLLHDALFGSINAWAVTRGRATTQNDTSSNQFEQTGPFLIESEPQGLSYMPFLTEGGGLRHVHGNTILLPWCNGLCVTKLDKSKDGTAQRNRL